MEVLPPAEAVKQANLKAHVTELTKNGPRYLSDKSAVTAALTYLKKCLTDAGYTVTGEAFGTDAHEVNLCCELTGTGTGAVLEIGAHWDSVSTSPGADDNASGCAGLLEIARVLMADHKKGLKLARTVRFCLFGGEEDSPICTGSRHHVKSLKSAPHGVIVLEMIGYRSTTKGSQRIPSSLAMLVPAVAKLDTGDFIAAIGIADAASFLDELETAGKTHKLPVAAVKLPTGSTYAGSDVSRSDHAPYWAAGHKGVMVTDTAEFRNPNYHKSTDLIGTLDFDFAEQVTATVADAVRKLAAS